MAATRPEPLPLYSSDAGRRASGDHRGRGARRRRLEPATRCCFRTPATPSSISRATTSRWPTARCAAPAAGRTCSCAIRTASTASSSIQKRAPAVAAAVDRGRRRCSFPSGRTAEEVVPRDAAALVVDGQPRLPRAAPASGARRRSRSSRRAARRSRSGAGRRVAADPRRRRASCARRSTTSASSAGRRRPARAACTSTCASSGAGRSTRCAAPRSRSRARSSGARRRWRRASGGRKSATACSSTTTRTRRIARSPRAYSVRPTAGRARVGAARVGRDRRLRARRLHAGDDAGAVRGRSAIGTPASTSMPCSLDALLELSARQEREGLGDAPWPPHYRKQAGRAAARPAVAAPHARRIR